ncbi:MAG: DUF4352 domain-containing protein [Lachnospiraceae bacterium]|nr:DUF4352 domain-containing protein [Lachnospiraceae bacterium]
MLKKMKGFLVGILCCVMLTGCNDVIDLTEEQSTMIAEYAAGLLLKYDLNYEDRIAEGMQEAKTEEGSAETEEEAATEEETEEPEKGVSEKKPVEVEEVSVGTEHDIAKIVGIEGASITFKDYQVMDQYPTTDGDDESIYLEASNGYKLLVVRFNVTNTTEDVVDISLLDSSIDYRIVCNGSKAADPMLTILMDDLGTLETSVKPDEDQEAVLIFQISENIKDTLDTIELKVDYNDMENVIKIK